MESARCEGEPLVHTTMGGYLVHCTDCPDYEKFVTHASKAFGLHSSHRSTLKKVVNPCTPEWVESIGEALDWSL